jgi:hypothetical protein
VGLSISKNKFEKLTKESTPDITEIKKEKFKIATDSLYNKDVDSLKKEVLDKMNASFIPIPDARKKQVLKEIEKGIKDTTAIKLGNGNKISFGGSSKLDTFMAYQKKYPDSKIDVALDRLGYDKNFTNRFLFTRARAVSSLVKKDNRENYLTDLLSYASISLFIFLPIFTLFLKLFYIRRKYTYIDHLIFVFHTQTVFFMLLTLLYLITFFTSVTLDSAWVFMLLFLVYLFIAMKIFYAQGYFKTFIKFILLNTMYLFIGTIGIVIVGLISFAFY